MRGVAWSARERLGDVAVSLHPAGHILGSAQVRVERDGEVWVVSGDYKRDADASCEPFELVRCDTFVTEATFARPDHRWESGSETVRAIYDWWEGNRARERVSVLYVYALGKAQRVLAELPRFTDRAVWVHYEVETLVACYRDEGVALAPTRELPRKVRGLDFRGELILASPRYAENSWHSRLGDVETAFASGWMDSKSSAHARGFDRGFALSDHADWDDILRTIAETGARRVLTCHGDASQLIAHLRAHGVDAGRLDSVGVGFATD